ncbi:MAG: relaxase/mobilization nuclease domain-containing protein [Gammaproteobacteria bacterium]
MPKKLIDTGGRPLLDLTSYARRGPGRRAHLSLAEVELIQRTVTRTPEVMVKVLSRGANTLKTVRAHFAYLNRGGELEIETDEGERLAGKAVSKRLLEDWDLDVEQHRRRADLRPGKDWAPPRLVHKILFSMPPGTPPKKVLEAVKNFAREEFALQHRYAMVLHTDEPHPHVHLVVKAMSEQGVRLNIRKETLRRWRSEFAAHLRRLGVAANATDRAVRGSVRPPVSDGVYRASQRGESTVMQAKARSDSRSAASSSAKARLVQTREAVLRGWMAVSDLLRDEQRYELASQVHRFAHQMPPPRTEYESMTQVIARDRAAPNQSSPPSR